VTERTDYSVAVERGQGGWEVVIADLFGRPVHRRACGDETEARTFASTVQQHLYWLSSDRFREYYRLHDPAES
jgi:hypothetical protein